MYISKLSAKQKRLSFVWTECRICDTLIPRGMHPKIDLRMTLHGLVTESNWKSFLFAPKLTIISLSLFLSFRESVPLNFLAFCLPFQWPKISNLIFWNMWTFSFDHSFIRLYIFASKSARWRCAAHKSQIHAITNVCASVSFISLAKFQCVNGEKFIDLLFTKNKKQNTPTQNLI